MNRAMLDREASHADSQGRAGLAFRSAVVTE